MQDLGSGKTAERPVRLGGAPVTLFPQVNGENTHITQYYADPGPSREKMRGYLETAVFDKSLITEELIEERYQASTPRPRSCGRFPNASGWSRPGPRSCGRSGRGN